jgi:DNA polymerase I
MELQILDCDYIMLSNKPVVRIFGRTQAGESICVFYEDFLPYFYLEVSEENFEAVEYELNKNDLKFEIVEKTLPIGFQKPKKVFKIFGKDPSKIPEIRNFVSSFGTPYEADVLFKYRFMVDHDLKGMQWIDVEGSPIHTTTVKCKAFKAEKIKPLDVLKNIPLKYLSLDIECLSAGNRLPEPEEDPIIMVSLCFSPEYKGKKEICIVAKPTNLAIGCNDEKEMLEKLKSIIEEYDPDIITGYNIENFDIPYILKRMEVLKVPRDIGRSEKLPFTNRLSYTKRTNICGRIIIDPFYIIRYLSVYDQPYRFKRYDLGTVAQQILGETKMDLGKSYIVAVNEAWKHSNEKLKKLIEYCIKDSDMALKFVVTRKLVDMDKFIEMSKLCGLLLQDVMGGQAARHESELLHELKKRNILMPCKPRKVRKEEQQYKGALVLEPVVGLHKNGCTLILDFTSLYPSLIIRHNICPTTLVKTADGLEVETSPSGSSFVTKKVREGIFPSIAKYLLKTRAEIRKQFKMEKDTEVRRILDAKQYALKGMGVSLYGYTGFAGGRFFTVDVASSITSWGRENIEFTRKLVEETFGYKVIYGDTDSIFLKTDITDLDEAMKKGEEISKFVTGKLDGLELKFEKLFKTFLILSKKRYAGLAFEKTDDKWKEKISMKGIETIRRDWCELTSDTMRDVLETILKEGDILKASKHVRSIINDLSKGLIPLDKLTVVKGITKALDSYDGIQPHVEVAKKIIKRDPTRKNIVGERLGYVIVRGNQMLSKRAEDPQYVKENKLEIDSQYYIENQLLPPLERIFEVCGISSSELLEGSKQKILSDIYSQNQTSSPENTVLQGFENVVCKKCDWSFRRPTLTGNCPKCNSSLYFSSGGSIGKVVDFSRR